MRRAELRLEDAAARGGGQGVSGGGGRVGPSQAQVDPGVDGPRRGEFAPGNTILHIAVAKKQFETATGLSLQQSKSKKVVVKHKHTDWLGRKRSVMMVVASLISTVAFQARLSHSRRCLIAFLASLSIISPTRMRAASEEAEVDAASDGDNVDHHHHAGDDVFRHPTKTRRPRMPTSKVCAQSDCHIGVDVAGFDGGIVFVGNVVRMN
ncbi:hypothetical protein Acr_12g0010300 [Actinidia rufa]|uniref:Uncharacterized protein n=1 Tax=Actinidia rufa TaxID=165716 RepID=A0A7J0FJZ8_9ERIC|nr:hypothetical protein Acr_12g0010300 [Actinidia rufa]